MPIERANTSRCITSRYVSLNMAASRAPFLSLKVGSECTLSVPSEILVSRSEKECVQRLEGYTVINPGSPIMHNPGIEKKDTLGTQTDGCPVPITNCGCQFYLDTAFQIQYLSLIFSR